MANITVIGAGAAGMMAALAAADGTNSVRILEKNEKLGKKIYITGKGRCNYTNACDFNTFIGNIVSNPKFMYSSIRAFSQEEMTELLENEGCQTKVERGQRAFPLSDRASDITRALKACLERRGVKEELNTEVISVELNNRSNECKNHRDTPSASENDEKSTAGFIITARKKNGKRAVYSADRVIIATGGLSYPSTGSTGDGYRFAEELGLSVKKTSPALVPLETADINDEHRRLQGVSLKNVKAVVYEEGNAKPFYESEIGELLFTHFGLSGPLVLSVSSVIGKGLADGKKYKISIDLKPALTDEQLDLRLLRDFHKALNMNIENALSGLLISSLREPILERAGIEKEKKVRDISRAERMRLLGCIKGFELDITGTRGYNEAIITQGGVDIGEIDPKRMESKKHKGLFFAGEVLDVDAYTGGFNLQIAWSTGHAAGTAAAK